MYQPKDTATFGQQLKVQTLDVTTLDPQLFTTTNAGADLVIFIREPVAKVYTATKVSNAGTLSGVAQSNIVIVDSTAYTAGGDAFAIRLNATTLSSGDCVTVKYRAQD